MVHNENIYKDIILPGVRFGISELWGVFGRDWLPPPDDTAAATAAPASAASTAAAAAVDAVNGMMPKIDPNFIGISFWSERLSIYDVTSRFQAEINISYALRQLWAFYYDFEVLQKLKLIRLGWTYDSLYDSSTCTSKTRPKLKLK